MQYSTEDQDANTEPTPGPHAPPDKDEVIDAAALITKRPEVATVIRRFRHI